MTTSADPRRRVEAEAVIARFSDVGYDPVSVTALNAYATVQAWAQAVETTGTTDSETVSSALRRKTFDTVLGKLGFDIKGDVTRIETFEWVVWKDGAYVPLEEKDLTD